MNDPTDKPTTAAVRHAAIIEEAEVYMKRHERISLVCSLVTATCTLTAIVLVALGILPL